MSQRMESPSAEALSRVAERYGGGETFRYWGPFADAGLVALFLALVFLLGCFPMKDTDFWWHLKAGDWIREQGTVPRTDLFTFTVPDRPWIDLHWGFQVALSWVYERWGIVGVNLAKCVITCSAALLLITTRRSGWPVWVMILVWLPALVVLSGRIYVRPETLTLFYLSAFLAILFRWDLQPRLAYLLPLVQCAWVNSQGLFILGPVLLLCALIDAALRPGAFSPQRRSWWRTIGIATGLTLLACLINPYGIEGALFPLALTRTMGSPIFREHIAELTPISTFIERNAGLRNVMLLFHLGTMMLGAMSFLLPITWRVGVRLAVAPEPPAKSRGGKRPRKKTGASDPSWRLSSFRLLIFLGFSALSWQATRNSHQYAAVVGSVTAWNFGEWAAAISQRRSPPKPARVFAGRAMPRFATGVVVALVLASVASGLFYRFTGEGRVVGLGFEPLWFPHEAVKFSGRPEMPPRFASFSFGWAPLYSYHFGPDRKVFIDPRLEVAGPDLYERYVDLERRITLKAPGWPEALDALERPVILIGHAGLSDPGEMARTGVALLAHPRWELVYFDPQASVYVHDSYQEVVRSHRVDLQARHFGRDRRSEPQGTVALLAGARSLWSYALGLQEQGRLDLVQTVIPLGLDYARRVLASEPENPNAWKLFGLLLAAREVPSESPVARYRQPFDPLFDLTAVRATAALRHALELKPDDFVLQFQLALTYQSRQMTEAAQPLIDALLDRPPMNPLQIRLQDSLRAQRGPQLSPIVPGRFRNRNELEQQVNSLLAEGRADSVAQVLEREFPPEARSWPLADRLATIRLHLGQPKQARLIWEAVADPPRPALQAARIAVTHFAEGDYEAAGRHYRKALMLEPDLFEAHYGLARLKADAGRASESAAAAEGAVACAPSEVARTSAQLLLDSVAPYR